MTHKTGGNGSHPPATGNHPAAPHTTPTKPAEVEKGTIGTLKGETRDSVSDMVTGGDTVAAARAQQGNQQDSAQDRLDSVRANLQGKADDLKDSFTDKSGQLRDTMAGKTDELRGGLSDKTDELKGMFTDKSGQLKETMSGKTDELKGVFTDRTEQFKGTVGDRGEQAKQSANEKSTQAGERLTGLADTLREKTQGLPDAAAPVVNAATKAASALEQTGTYLQESTPDDWMGDLKQLISRKPVESVLIAAGLGYMLARAFRK